MCEKNTKVATYMNQSYWYMRHIEPLTTERIWKQLKWLLKLENLHINVSSFPFPYFSKLQKYVIESFHSFSLPDSSQDQPVTVLSDGR